MPRPQLPPTPSGSMDIVGKEKIHLDEQETLSTLPPSAFEITGLNSTMMVDCHLTRAEPCLPVISTDSKDRGRPLQRKRTLSGTTKSRSGRPAFVSQDGEDSLPPPPSRARKIIQMKPKQTASIATEKSSKSMSKPTTNSQEVPSYTATTSKRKQTQPSATSVAGRKIARKTAHSIIERRRRCKMNEEFGVLKNMIPACIGIEMHKLAILQAGIEYVRYLEGCVEQLKEQTGNVTSHKRMSHQGDLSADEEEQGVMDLDNEDKRNQSRYPSPSAILTDSDASSTRAAIEKPAARPQRPLPPMQTVFMATSHHPSIYHSPELRSAQYSSSPSITSVPQTSQPRSRPLTAGSEYRATNSASPPPLTLYTPLQTGMSPAFGALNFSPEINRVPSWSAINGSSSANKLQHKMMPLPQAALPFESVMPATTQDSLAACLDRHSVGSAEEHAEATATEALLMMTKDRRGSITTAKPFSGKGMSVKDLLIS